MHAAVVSDTDACVLAVAAGRRRGGGATELKVVPDIRVGFVDNKMFLIDKIPEVVGDVGGGVRYVTDSFGDGGGGESYTAGVEAFPAENVLTGCEVDQLWRSLCVHEEGKEWREKRGQRERRKKGRREWREKRGERESRKKGREGRPNRRYCRLQRLVSDRLTYHRFVSVADKQKCGLNPLTLSAVADVTLGIVEDDPFPSAQSCGKMVGIWSTQMNGAAVCEGGGDGG